MKTIMILMNTNIMDITLDNNKDTINIKMDTHSDKISYLSYPLS